MALPALLNGADCGPSNPLQALSKQFERDRGVQQDHFGPASAGPSREVFRTQSTTAPAFEQDATRFFSGQGSSSVAFVPQHAPNAFDLSALRGSLPLQQVQPVKSPASSAWAGDFLNLHSPKSFQPKSHSESIDFSFNASDANRPDAQQTANLSPIYFPGIFKQPLQPMFHERPHPDIVRQQSEATAATLHSYFPPEETVTQPQAQAPVSDPDDADELARTAGLLIDTVKDETNPKFQSSAFLGLMRQLRDGEMIVEGSEMVKGPTVVPIDDNLVGPQKLTQGDIVSNGMTHMGQEVRHSSEPFVSSESDAVAFEQRQLRQAYRQLLTESTKERFELAQPSAANVTLRKSVHFENGMDETDDSEDAFWRKENEEFQEYWRTTDDQRESLHGAMPEWDRLQDDWDRFEATATGIKPVSVYHFQPNNPYLMGESSTRNHAIHSERLDQNESLLEKEATVQKNPRNAAAWFELGVKQQENERELQAIQALQRAVELDPSYLAAWLALAISHTNENDRNGAYDAIENWVRNNVQYDGVRLLSQLEGNGGKTARERHEGLIRCLVGLARTMPEGKVDADIQTALGVLLNTNEEYEKAQDCFQTALAVRPNDWLLYNRVGATLANSGRAGDALWYYYRALDLNPSYIRARFNLGISCINMKRYREAAEHILDALSLQENDVFESTDTRGITPSALWDCLRTTCVQLQKEDLTVLCDLHDLDGIRKAFLDVTM